MEYGRQFYLHLGFEPSASMRTKRRFVELQQEQGAAWFNSGKCMGNVHIAIFRRRIILSS